MQEENRFFRYVWRLNAVLFAAGGLLILFAVFGGYSLLFHSHDQAAPNLVVAPKGAPAARYILSSDPENLGGGQGLLFTLEKYTDEPRGLSSYSPRGETVNLLVVNGDAVGHWIFPGIGQRICQRTRIGISDEEDSPVAALVMSVAQSDTNKDGEISCADSQMVYAYPMNARGPSKLFSADTVRSVTKIGPSKVLIVFDANGNSIAAVVATADLRVVSRKLLPKTGG